VLREAAASLGRGAVLEAARTVVAEARERLEREPALAVDGPSLAQRAADRLAGRQPALRRVLNVSGVLLHTGLGRSPLAAEALEAVVAAAQGYCNLETDLETGQRGKRTTGVAPLLARLTGAEAATVVNNNAGATVLALHALAAGREVIVARGQLVEIGGSFRLPEIFESSGARLREVGTTNRTRLSDYQNAIGPDTAALLRVHASNYRIVGFTESVPIASLAALGRERGLWTIDDIGSGALATGLLPHLADEPTAAGGIAAGADAVLFSGDKLLGGPQSGIIIGSRKALALIESDPLMRALRVDKLTLAALEATLRLALDPDHARRRIPLWSFLSTPEQSLRTRAEALAESFREAARLNATVISASSVLGGGSAPLEPIPSVAVRVASPFPACYPTEAALARALRLGNPAVFTRVHSGGVEFDLRTLPESDDETVLSAVLGLFGRQ
jgi:L-seryl-tRNA(Ser) seleniumtransferase